MTENCDELKAEILRIVDRNGSYVVLAGFLDETGGRARGTLHRALNERSAGTIQMVGTIGPVERWGRARMRLRPARPESVDGGHDRDLILAWRNDWLTRAMSLSARLVGKRAHARWYDLRCGSIRILERDGVEVGAWRVDPDGDVNVMIAPEHRGLSLGTVLVQMGTRDANRSPLRATVRLENTASMRAFLRAGYAWTPCDARRRLAYLEWQA